LVNIGTVCEVEVLEETDVIDSVVEEIVVKGASVLEGFVRGIMLVDNVGVVKVDARGVFSEEEAPVVKAVDS